MPRSRRATASELTPSDRSSLGVMEFDAVLFDAGGVFVLPDPAVMGAVLAPYGAATSWERHHRAHYFAMWAKSNAGDGETDWDAYDRAYIESVGVAAADVELAVALLGDVRSPHLWRAVIDDNRRALAELGASGIPVGVVSNAAGQVEAALARLEVCQVGAGPGTDVRVVVDSHVVGVAKPDPRIFEFALERFAEFDRDRIAYVGDSVGMDVVGARAAGLVPILIDPYDDHSGTGFRRIRRIGDLIGTRPGT